MFKFLNRFFRRTDDSIDNVIGGADAVFTAILEHADGEQRYIVELGEPQLVDRGGQYSNDLMVRIPTFTQDGEPDPPNVEYNIPSGEDGESGLFDLLDAYDIDQVADIAQLEAKTVVGELEDGTITLRFDLLNEE